MPDAIRPLDVILKKRAGGELSKAEIALFVSAVVRSGDASAASGEPVSAAQIAAFLMAVFQRGLSLAELANLTEAMRSSGETFSAAPDDGVPPFLVDKHSTGGVGDKTSLLVAPIVAAVGLRRTPQVCVPMISGRSLGHTGGTLDKLETIPGFNTQLSLQGMDEVLRRCGAVMVGQTPQLVPADRILYALRDHTGTVESPDLIAASIMSKKLAEDLGGLVLDVKVGSGAFLPSYEASRHLAELMVRTGERAGTRTVALLTEMNEPLGRFAGNWVEIWECVDIFRGVRHPMSANLIELSCVLAGWMLHLAGAAASPELGAALADEVLRDGRAYAAWLCMVAAQGGEVSVFEDPARFHKPRVNAVVRAKVSGYLADMDCKQVGWAVQHLGAGRTQPGEPVSAHAGLEAHVKLGGWVEAGQPVFTLFGEEASLLKRSLRMIEETLQVSKEPPAVKPIVHDTVHQNQPTLE